MNCLSRRVLAFLALTAATLLSTPARSTEQHPWISAPVRAQPPASYFSNLRDGDRIETPFVLKFGLGRYGLAPVTKPAKQLDGTGHHHLLVNRDLPLNFTEPLPSTDQYIHFGKGQMETVLTFAPGTYKLRLLLADHKHIPYFIYSEPMTITVTGHNDKVDPKSLLRPGVAILEPRSGESSRAPVRVRLHASAFGVGHTDIKEAGTGHFRLVAERAGAPAERIDLTSGRTEVWLAPPPGQYKLHVELVANADGRVMATSPPIDLAVQGAATAPH